MEKIKIGDACEILNGYAFKSDNYVDSGIRIIRIANVQKGFLEDNAPAFYPASFTGIEKYMLEEGDLLISLTGNVGRVAILEKEFLPASLNQRVACLRLKTNKIKKGYLFHILNSDYFEQQCIQAAKGVAQKNMSTEWLKEYKIPLYSQTEQEEISQILDKCREIIFKRKEELENLNNLIKARFVEMFGDPVSNPLGWPVKRLADLSILITNGSTPKGGSENYVSEGVVFLRSQNIWRNRIALDEVVYIDAATHMAMRKSSVHDKDILITKTGRINTENSSLGRAALFRGADDSANINGHVYLVRLDGTLIPEYVVAILTGEPYRQYIRKVCVGGIDKRQINLDQVEDFPIIFPPIALQEQFTAFVNQVDKSKVAVQKALDEAQLLFDSLMQEYFG